MTFRHSTSGCQLSEWQAQRTNVFHPHPPPHPQMEGPWSKTRRRRIGLELAIPAFCRRLKNIEGEKARRSQARSSNSETVVMKLSLMRCGSLKTDQDSVLRAILNGRPSASISPVALHLWHNQQHPKQCVMLATRTTSGSCTASHQKATRLSFLALRATLADSHHESF